MRRSREHSRVEKAMLRTAGVHLFLLIAYGCAGASTNSLDHDDDLLANTPPLPNKGTISPALAAFLRNNPGTSLASGCNCDFGGVCVASCGGYVVVRFCVRPCLVDDDCPSRRCDLPLVDGSSE